MAAYFAARFFLVGATMLSAFSHDAGAQSRIVDSLDVNTGVSLAEWFTVGARYRFGQNNAGISMGSFPGGAGRFGNIAVFVTYYRHLFGHSRYTHQRPWFVKTAVSYHYQRYKYFEPPTQDGVVMGRLHVGCELNFSRRCGLSVSSGVNMGVYSHFTEFETPGRWFGPASLGIDALFFFRIKSKK
jgi:hypothetical protein